MGETLSDDLLEGADAIATFLYGDTSKRRKVYHLASEATSNKIPIFRMGSAICARRSTLLTWIEGQEKVG